MKDLSITQKLLVKKLDNSLQQLEGLVGQQTSRTNFKRDSYYVVDRYLKKFRKDPSKRNTWIIMGGLRGTGKTTILSQLYLKWFEKTKKDNSAIFYLSLDEAYALSANFIDIQAAIEYKLEESIYFSKRPIYLFLDEIHFIDKWSVNAKILYDRCSQLFLLCTGSSAVSFWMNADIARRAKIVNIKPLSLLEFVNMKVANQPNLYKQSEKETNRLNSLAADISNQFRDCFLHSKNSDKTWDIIQPLNKQMSEYNKTWQTLTNIPNSNLQRISINSMVNQYINYYMSLPYVVGFNDSHLGETTKPNFQQEEDIRTSIVQTVENIFNKDLNALDSFSQEVKLKFFNLLLILANSDTTSLNSLSKDIKVNIQTLQSMLKVLTEAQTVSAIPPLGASFGKISKPYKYLFNSPAIRQALSPVIIREGLDSRQINVLRGRLLEDAVYLSLRRMFEGLFYFQIEYDASQGGADFVIVPRSGIKQEAIVIEVGYNKKSYKQIEKTLKKVGNQGLIITTGIDRPRRSTRNQDIIYIPLELFLLGQSRLI